MAGNDRKSTLELAEELGWREAGQGKKGYTKLKCPCGKHITWLHKTPSNPNYWKERVTSTAAAACLLHMTSVRVERDLLIAAPWKCPRGA